MTASEEFMPDSSEWQALVAAAMAPEICRVSADLGIESTYSAHAFAHGEESTPVGSVASSWTVRTILRTAHTKGRALVQFQAKLAVPHPSGYSGFIIKGGYDLGSPSSFSARSRTNEYNTVGFRAWA